MELYIPRDIEPVVRAALRQAPAVAVTGPRQSGKSTLLRHLLPDYAYLTLDDPLTRRQALEDPELLLDGAGGKVVLDEIQYAPSLLSHIKMRIDRNRGAKGRFVLTGSQQFALMKGLSETLAGRIALLELLPFGLREARRAGAPASPRAAFVQMCLRGSFPEVAVDASLDARRWYASYVQTYLERDIRAVYDVGSLREFERFLQVLASRCAQTLHLSALAGDIGVAVNTVKRWVSILEACRMIYLLPPYHRNLGSRTVKAPKTYFLDAGLVCYLTGLHDADHLLAGPMAGQLFENYCVQEALKATWSAGARPRFFHLRTKGGLEVDLVVEGAGGRVRPFEFKLSATPKPEMARPLGRFCAEVRGSEDGGLVSLFPDARPLADHVRLLPLDGFLDDIRTMAVV